MSNNYGPANAFENVPWCEILEPVGWTFVGIERSGAELWLRPGGASSKYSLKAFEHAAIVWSDNAGLPVGRGQRLTKFRLWCHLNGVDESEGARVIRQAANEPQRPATTAVAATASEAGSSDLTGVVVPAPGMGHVPSPYGQLHLDPAAADAWNAMRQEALSVYGADIYPAGTVSAYRTYEQQAALYDLFLNGTGAPANPPGTSAHRSSASRSTSKRSRCAR